MGQKSLFWIKCATLFQHVGATSNSSGWDCGPYFSAAISLQALTTARGGDVLCLLGETLEGRGRLMLSS